MDTLTKNREQIIESIKTLPEDSLTELINFVDYLRYKATEKQSPKTSRNFLLSVTALGSSESVFYQLNMVNRECIFRVWQRKTTLFYNFPCCTIRKTTSIYHPFPNS
ncbi:MAG: DUF2281 domain-containing protein [Cuspidothrix sp.]